ncbi:uncharacterized protein TNCV_1650261 [Trichonephila clavipes]|nr:uncharacterized protein TNCV_1650261 [Trichonephila clavipes]
MSYLSRTSPMKVSAVPGFCQTIGALPPLLDSVVGGVTPERKCLRVHMDPSRLCPGKGLVLPKTNIDEIAAKSRFLLVSLANDDMSKISPFAIHKALIGIGGEPKSVKRLRFGDLLIKTSSALQTKPFLLAKLFLDSKCISFYSFRFHIVVYHSGKYLALRISSIKPTTQIESRLPEPISSAAALNNTLNTSTLSLSAETCPITTSNKVAALSTEIQPLVPLPESVPTTSNSEHSNAPEIPQCVKQNSRNRRKRPKVQKAEIEIKMAPHKPRKSALTELTTDDEDMITYDVEEEELEPDPAGKFPIKEDPLNFPKGYLRSLKLHPDTGTVEANFYYYMYCLTLF